MSRSTTPPWTGLASSRAKSLDALSTVATGVQLSAQQTLLKSQRKANEKQVGDTKIAKLDVQSVNLDNSDPDLARFPRVVNRATPTRQEITADTTVAKLASLWLKFLFNEGRIETTTINEYERVLTKVVIPELGGLRLREVTTSRLDLFLVRLRATSTSRQRKPKVVLGAMLGMAVRHDALAVNPVQQTSRIYREKSENRSLTLEDLNTADQRAHLDNQTAA